MGLVNSWPDTKTDSLHLFRNFILLEQIKNSFKEHYHILFGYLHEHLILAKTQLLKTPILGMNLMCSVMIV